MVERCPWCGNDPVYIAYHDDEWGQPEYDSRNLWEMLVLEGFQAGLSWITILRRRDAFRQEFEGFDPENVAKWDEARVEKAAQNEGIIRHRGKIRSTVESARLMLEIEADQGFSNYLWSFVGDAPIQNNFKNFSDVPAETEISRIMSKDLKKRGFKFCGPVIVYAFMQATGMVNDHLTGCFRHKQLS